MKPELPPQLVAQRDALVENIYAAFRGVSREGGVSWNETIVHDDYGGKEERLRARATDTDRAWTDLVDDPEWPPKDWRGGPSFLDAIGFRYYLPVLMLRELAGEGAVESLEFHLTLSDGEMQDYTLAKWSSLDGEQRRCVRRFLRYMVAQGRALGDGTDEEWIEPLISYWEGVE